MGLEDRTRRGFTAVELLAAVAAAGVLACAVLLSSGNQRRLARLGDDLGKLKTIAAATGQYAADCGDRFWTFSWRRGPAPLDPNDPNGVGLFNAPDDLQAAANQAVYLLRTRGGRNNPLFPIITSWFPHALFNHLPLADYLDLKIPSRLFISSADRERLKWANDYVCFDQNCFAPCQPDAGSLVNRRWPYSGSFMPGVAFFDLSPIGSRISQVGSPYNQYVNSFGAILGGANLTTVSFPSQKVMIHDQNARHFGSRQPYCVHDQARLPLLMADGSVQVRSAAEANRGCDPNNPSPSAFTQMLYNASSCWEPAPLAPGGDFMPGRFRYTRQGVGGRDFGGPEIP